MKQIAKALNNERRSIGKLRATRNIPQHNRAVLDTRSEEFMQSVLTSSQESRESYLQDPYLPRNQRQAVLTHIGHTRGNRHVQRLVDESKLTGGIDNRTCIRGTYGKDHVQQKYKTGNTPNMVQRRVVCDPEDPTICWSEADTFTPSSEPNMSYWPPGGDQDGFGLSNISTPTSEGLQSIDTTTSPTSQNDDWQFLDNPIWNAITHNAVSGAAGLFENINPIGVNLPTVGNALRRVGGMRGWEAALRAEDALSYPATRLPGVFGQSGSIPGSGLPMGMSRASAVLAPLGVVSNAYGIYDAITRPNTAPGSSGLERGGDVLSSGAGLFSSGVGTTALAGAGLTSVGATGTGAAITSGAAALGPAAAVAGAGAGGYALGRLLDEGLGGLMNFTGASDWVDEMRGIARPEGQHGDYSISGSGATLATAADQAVTGGLRSFGVFDESRPAYTQTLGWRLAEILPSWLQ